MMRLVWFLVVAEATGFLGCVYSPPAGGKYFPCGEEGQCREGCSCVPGGVCAPNHPDGSPVECKLCPEGFDDCDPDGYSGCMVRPAVDPAHCGGCGTICPQDKFCQDGTCVGACRPDLVACDGGCVDTRSDPYHCGGCGVACDPGLLCSGGACTRECPEGSAACYGGCVDTLTDPSHCGGCGSICRKVPHGMGACQDGICVVNSCEEPFRDCDGLSNNGCEVDLQHDPAHCGGCDLPCAGVQPACCAGHCRDLASDPGNCGGCDQICAPKNPECLGDALLTYTPVCAGGTCDLVTVPLPCPNGCQGDACVGDPCSGKTCRPGEICSGGECRCGPFTACDPAQACCQGECVDTDTDASHCGGCTNNCPSLVSECQGDTLVTFTPVCAGGTCDLIPVFLPCPYGCLGDACVGEPCSGPSCDNNQTCCFGFCVDLASNASYCGDCNTSCPFQPPVCLGEEVVAYEPICTTGTCGHLSIFIPCPYGCDHGACIDDPCQQCQSGQTCCQSVCTDTAVDPFNCGLCNTSCPAGLGCAGGLCHGDGVLCGGQPCNVMGGAQTCCFDGTAAACFPEFTVCPVFTPSIECDDRADCTMPHHCCFTDNPSILTQCMQTCAEYVCVTDLDCLEFDRMLCDLRSPFGIRLGVCVPGP